MKKQIIIAVLAALASPAFAADYTGTTTVSSGQTLTIQPTDTITQPSQFVIDSGGTLVLAPIESTTVAANPGYTAGIAEGNIGGVSVPSGTGTIDYTGMHSGSGGGFIGGGFNILGGTGATGGGTLIIDNVHTSNNYLVGNVGVSGDQSIQAENLALDGNAPTDLTFGLMQGVASATSGSGNIGVNVNLASGATTQTLKTLTIGDTSASNNFFDLGLENATLTISDALTVGGPLSIGGGGVSTLNLSGTQVSLATGVSVETGDASVFTVNASGSTWNLGSNGGLNLQAGWDGTGSTGGTLNFNASGAEINGNMYVDAPVQAVTQTGQQVQADQSETPVVNLDLENATVTGTLGITGSAQSAFTSINVNASNATIGGITLAGVSGGSVVFSAAALNDTGGFTIGSYGLSGVLATVNGSIGGNVDMAGGALNILPTAASTGLQVGGNYLQTGGNLTIPISPSQAWGLNAKGNYEITGGDVIVDGETGSYANGTKYTLIQSALASGNQFSPASVLYVYNGGGSATIDGLTPQIKAGSAAVDLCLGSACTATPAPAPASSAVQVVTSTPTPAATPATSAAPVITTTTPTPAPATTSVAPVVTPAPAPVIIPVQVVTPVQEASSTLANAPQATIRDIQDTSTTLISTGVIGGGPRGLWMKGLGGFSQQGDYRGDNQGVLIGRGKSVGPDGRDVAGAAFSYGSSSIGTSSSDYTAAQDYGLWAYGTFYPQASRAWKVTAAAGGGWTSNTLASTALGLPQAASFGGNWISAAGRVSYWKHWKGLVISPRLSMGYDQSWTSGFQTHGAGPLDVAAAPESNGQFTVSPAVLVGKEFRYRHHTLFPQIRAGLVENIGPAPMAALSSGQVAGQVQGLAYPHTQGMVEARLDMISHTKFSKGLAGNIAARETFGGGASSTEFVATVKYRW